MSEGAGDSITIHFSLTSSPSTPRITKTIRKEAKASELRVVAADATQIPIASLKLIYRGRIIQDDDKVISGYCVENDCVIHCLGKPVVVEPSVGTASSTASVPVTSTASTPSVETTSTTNTSGSGASTSFSVEAALQNLKSKNEAGTYSTALTTLGKVVSNIISNPTEEKYRKVKQSNAAFGRRLGNVQGGRDAILAVGFISEIPEGTDEYHFVLKPNAEAWNHLLQSKTKIDAEIELNKRNQYVPPPIPTTSPATPFMPSPGAFTGAGNIPGMPPMTPAMQQQMSNLMSNPEMLRNMMSNPMIQQAMSDPNIINQMTQGMDPMMRQRTQQMMSDPMMRQRMQQMMSDPAMMQMMMNQMSNMGGMGSGSNVGTVPASTTTQPDPAALARMMQGFSQMQNANNNPSQQQGASNSGAGNNNSSNEREMTEEEMIAEAIARSLRDP